MEIVIYGASDFSFKGAYVCSKFSFCSDFLVTQTSTFTVSDEPSFSLGDILLTRDGSDFGRYIGIVSKLAKSPSSDIWTVQCSDMSSVLSKPVVAVGADSVTYGAQFASLVTSALISNSDKYQNLPWLTVTNSSTATGATPAYGNDNSRSLLDILSDFESLSSLTARFIPFLDASGRCTGIELLLSDRAEGTAIRLDESCISDCQISDGDSSSINKLVLQPSTSNILSRTVFIYYLLSDGTMTTDSTDAKRIYPVVYGMDFYTDAQYYQAQLSSIAAEKLTIASYNHTVSFKAAENSMFDILSIRCGDKVSLWLDGDLTSSIVTQISFEGSMSSARITCGYQRVSLTDKVKLKERAQSTVNSYSSKATNAVQSGSIPEGYYGNLAVGCGSEVLYDSTTPSILPFMGESVAIGLSSKAYQFGTVAGFDASGLCYSSVYGDRAVGKEESVVLGANATGDKHSVVAGVYAAGAYGNVIIGYYAKGYYDEEVCIGSYTNSKEGGTAVGHSASGGKESASFGSRAYASDYSVSIGYKSVAYVPYWVSFDGELSSNTINRTIAVKSTDYIFFRNEDVDSAKTTQASYASGHTLTYYLDLKADKTALDDYLKSADASSTYLTKSDAESTYLTKGDASSTYLTISNASSTYLTKSSASTGYAAKSHTHAESEITNLTADLAGKQATITGLDNTAGANQASRLTIYKYDTKTHAEADSLPEGAIVYCESDS